MSRAALLAGLAALAATATPAAAQDPEIGHADGAPVAVEVGKGRLVRLPRAATGLFIADPAVADVEVRSPRVFWLFGRRAGETSLFAVDAADRPVAAFPIVVGHDVAAIERALERALPGRGLRVGVANDALLLQGRVATAADAGLALAIAQRFVGGGDRTRVLDRLVVESPLQVNLQVRVAEVSRELVRSLGFSWEALGRTGDMLLGLATGNPVLGAEVGPGGFRTRTDGADSLVGALRGARLDINGVIDALERRGLVTILAEPNLTALSGVPASFLAGGEFPVPVPQDGNVTTIEYRRFGVSLAFVARVTDGGRINLEVKPEVSQLSAAGAIRMNGITVPALTTRRVETMVSLAPGESFAIAGLLQSGGQRELRQFPGLGDVPVLGELFRSRRFERRETELVVIVTPTLVQPPATAPLLPGEGAAGGACDQPGDRPAGCATRLNQAAMAAPRQPIRDGAPR